MAETRDLSYLINSPEYKQNAAFVTACYRIMLDRDVEAEELFRWCRQLDGVYSRESLIAALSGSVKFGNRFEIKDIAQYRKRAFVPRAVQHVINKLNSNREGYDKGCFGFMPRNEITFNFPYYGKAKHNWSDETEMLSLCQIEALRNEIEQQSKRFGSIRSIGVIADDLVEGSCEPSDTAFITSVDQIVSLIERDNSELRQMNNLLVPIPVPTENRMAVIFDGNWSARTRGKHPRRWLVNRGTGGILILSNHEYPVTVKLSFNLTTLVKGSSVRITQGKNSAVVYLPYKAAHITLNTSLLPGENEINFRYIGTASEAEEITNIAVSRFAIDGIENAMADDMRRLGSGYYAAVIPDSKVRNALHQSGYSEIECIRLYHDNSKQRERTTRFLQHDPNSSGDSFYVLNEGEKQESTAVSIRLYIARKTGEIDQTTG